MGFVRRRRMRASPGCARSAVRASASGVLGTASPSRADRWPRANLTSAAACSPSRPWLHRHARRMPGQAASARVGRRDAQPRVPPARQVCGPGPLPPLRGERLDQADRRHRGRHGIARYRRDHRRAGHIQLRQQAAHAEHRQLHHRRRVRVLLGAGRRHTSAPKFPFAIPRARSPRGQSA
jgi:hypothetical protein